jgi:hypothetical protein
MTAAALAAVAVFVPSVADAAQRAPITTSDLTAIRVGRHATYDRVVLDFRGSPPTSSRATWVPTLTADPSGKVVSLPGNKFLRVVVHNASGTDVGGNRTYLGSQRFGTPALRNVRAVAITGDFERVLSIGLGTRHRSWVHVFTLTGPSRLVIDVGR